MNAFSKILLLLLPLVSSFRAEENKSKERPSNLGFIDIVVESNVNRMLFTYQLGKNSLETPKNNIPAGSDDTSFVIITVPVKDFHCENPFGYKDFITLLKASQYPLMKIEIPRKAFSPDKSGNSVIVNGVSLSVAGISKHYDILCKVEQSGNENMLIIGTAMIRLTDLDIQPPVKSMGLVKIRNEIIVNFGFRLNEYVAENLIF